MIKHLITNRLVFTLKPGCILVLAIVCCGLISCSKSNNAGSGAGTNQPPRFTSSASVSVAENTFNVLTVGANDLDGDVLSYRLSGGVDRARFSIHASSGALRFNETPDFEVPADNDQNNIYQLQVSVSDGESAIEQFLTVTVTDLNEQAVGLQARPSNLTCAIGDAPVLSASIQLTQVFNQQSESFDSPTVLLQSPLDPNRWYVAEQYSGLIKTFLSESSTSDIFANLSSRLSAIESEMGLLGMAFHPDFASNGFVYVYYSAPAGAGSAAHHQSVISRFSASSALQLEPGSELEIMRIDQPFDNHNGGNIVFGVDGYLYIGMGDGGSGGDPLNNAQNINSLLGKMLRIDVDNVANGNNYSSPADNIYTGASGRDEIYASGLRNPWRWSFDRLNGDLIVADVGQSRREEIDFIVNGGNYGWRCYEGTSSFNTTGCQPESDYINPVYEYGRSSGRSITGGFIYRGNAIPALYGSYIYSDFYPGPIWGLMAPGATNQTQTSLLSNANFISSFAEDAQGEIYVVGYVSGQIFRIDPATDNGIGDFPDRLSETGCIDEISPLQMAAGLVPYDINAGFWSDGADKDRWMALPEGATITIEADGDWSFPENSVLVKNFSLQGKRIETRLLVRHTNGDWGGYSYEWNDAQTDAFLLLNGKTSIKAGQRYIFPSSSGCFNCHTQVSDFVLGPQTAQLNRDFLYPSTAISANQLLTLEHINYFTAPLSDVPENLTRLTDPVDESASLHDRARAYLYTNCAQCHRDGGPTNVNLDFDFSTRDADMNICNVNPRYPIGGATVILSPANSANSSMVLRMQCRERKESCSTADMMPPLASTRVDEEGSELVESWINDLGFCP